MKTDHLKEKLNLMIADLNDFHPEDWGDILSFLKQIKKLDKPSLIPINENHLNIFVNGAAFITYGYGIDGVSIEISKYGHTLYKLLSQFGKPSIHIIGGNIDPRVV